MFVFFSLLYAYISKRMCASNFSLKGNIRASYMEVALGLQAGELACSSGVYTVDS